ncbi:hypothetical protein WOA01_18035 [Methylocystis sp. IM2]
MKAIVEKPAPRSICETARRVESVERMAAGRQDGNDSWGISRQINQ